jgi:hypothetical protein
LCQGLTKMLIFHQQFGHELAQAPNLRMKHIHLLFQAWCLATRWNRHLHMAVPFSSGPLLKHRSNQQEQLWRDIRPNQSYLE